MTTLEKTVAAEAGTRPARSRSRRTGAVQDTPGTTGTGRDPRREPRLAGRRRPLLRGLRTAVPLVLLVMVLAVLAALVVVPRVMGWVPLTVLSGSMEPTIPTGSQVVAQPIAGEAAAARLEVGDIITVMPNPDDPTLVTHRIVTKVEAADGVHFTTQGDANDVVDEWDVTATQIRAEVRYWVPGAGYVATMLDGQQKSVSIVLAAGGLLTFAVVQVIGAVRENRRSRRTA